MAIEERVGSINTLVGRVSGLDCRIGDSQFEKLLGALLDQLDITVVKNADAILLATAVGEIELITRSGNRNLLPFVDLDRICSAGPIFDCIRGAQVISSGCAAGLDALGLALDQVASGIFRSVIVLAVDAPICPLIVGGFRSAGTLTSARTFDEFRGPFDVARSGFFLGEAGVALLVSQGSSSAEKSGASLCGWESVSSAYHMTGIRESGEDLYHVCEMALARAHISMQDLDWICGHASGTRMNDGIEAAVFSRLAKTRKNAIPIIGFKGTYGHCLGAGNLLDVAVCINSCRAGLLHPLTRIQNSIKEDGIEPLLDNLSIGDEATWMTIASSFSGIHTAMVIKWHS